MGFQAKPQYLPEDVKDYTAPRPRMDYLFAAIAACLALVAYMEPVEQATASVEKPEVNHSALHLEAFVACMNSGGWTWADPHTGEKWAVFCDKQRISKPL